MQCCSAFNLSLNLFYLLLSLSPLLLRRLLCRDKPYNSFQIIYDINYNINTDELFIIKLSPTLPLPVICSPSATHSQSCFIYFLI